MSVEKSRQLYKTQKLRLKLKMLTLQCKQMKQSLWEIKNLQLQFFSQIKKKIMIAFNFIKKHKHLKVNFKKQREHTDQDKIERRYKSLYKQNQPFRKAFQSKNSIEYTNSISMKSLYIKLKELKQIQQTEQIIQKQNTIMRKKNIQLSTFVNQNYRKIYGQKIQHKSLFTQNDTSKDQLIEALICKRGHKYYKGNVKQSIPDGEGKMNYCCFQGFLPECIESYEGSFKKGLFFGFGRIQYRGGVVFQGAFVKGKRTGSGFIMINGIWQQGKWENDKMIK